MGACSRLCDLITASLLPYVESKPARFRKEDERDLLLALSQVSREIERWTNEIGARSEDQEIIVKQLPDTEHNCFQHLEQSFRGDYNCLANIVSVLVAFLSYDSRFVQHISGNILVSASSFLALYGSNLVKFLHLLWISLEASVSSICIYGSSTSLVEYSFLVDQSLMQCSQHITDEISVADEPICDHTSFIVLLQSRLVNTNSLMVAGLFQILRRILKYVKQGSSDIEEKFILLTLSSLLRMPWNEFSTSQMLTSEENSGTKGLLEERTCLERHSKVLLGSVIQLFCSVVEHKDQEDVGGLKEFSVYVKFTNLVPKLICCFSKQLGTTDQHISGYFRHKVLDDMLLEMLLQLLDAPSLTFHVQNNKNDRPLEELKKDMCLLFSSIFNPIHLFHMFLLVLHYDHSVLIDYLISKDTGIPCVKYLLRCLRIICESWPTFVSFSICGTETDQSCYKRRKISRNKDCSRKSSPFRSTAMVRRQHSGRHKGCSMSKGVNIPTFINAKECLLCLQRSVEEIHQKKLFPYNPKPLLSRLSRFQVLCEHEECGARHHR